jgi:ABC-type multidrug transport system ATPase subunit
MDISTVITIKNIIRSRAADGKITIVSSHVLDFIKNIATKVVFIKDGYTIDKGYKPETVEADYQALFR